MKGERSSNTGSYLWSFLEQGGVKAVNLLVQVVLARLLAPEAFGVLAILLVVIEVANVISQSGLGTALVQAEEADDADFSTALWLSLGVSAVLYALLFAVAPALAGFYSMPDLAPYLRVLALVVVANAANSIQRSYLQRAMDFKSLARANVVASAISGAVGVAMAALGCGVWALVAQTLSLGVAACATMALLIPWRPKRTFRVATALRLLSYGWKICATGILNVLYTGVSELVVGRSIGASDLGMYSQGRKWPSAAISMATNALQNVMFPEFSRFASDPEGLRAAMGRSLRMGTFVVAPVSLLGAAAAEPFVALVLGEEWLPAVPIFRLTCAANAVLMLQLVNLRAYMAVGDSALYLRLNVVKCLLGGTLICGAAVFSRDIYTVAAVTSGFGVLSTLLVDMAPAKRVTGYAARSQLGDVFKTLLFAAASYVIAFAVTVCRLPALSTLLLQVGLFAVAYMGLSYLFGDGEIGLLLGKAASAIGRKCDVR